MAEQTGEASNPFIRRGGQGGMSMGPQNDGLAATEYWTAQEAPTTGDSWWSQTNWFRSSAAQVTAAEPTVRSETEIADNMGTAMVYNRFDSSKPELSPPPAPEPPRTRRVDLDGIGGLPSAVMKQISEQILLPLQAPQLFHACGTRPSAGVLLTGPPGCGKSVLVESILQALSKKLYYQKVDGAELVADKSCLKTITDLFVAAKANAPALIFIDQLDNLAPKPNAADSSAVCMLRAVLKMQLDKLDNKELEKEDDFVIVVGATHRLDAMDPTMLRRGRFCQKIELEMPEEKGRLEILELVTKRMTLGDDVALAEVAKRTAGFTGADLEGLATEAAMVCSREAFKDMQTGPKGKRGGVVVPEHLDQATLDSLRLCQRHWLGAIDSMPSNLRGMGRKATKGWSDVGGADAVKKIMFEALQYPLRFPDLFDKFQLHSGQGVLLYGPSGCGKTLLAEAIAGECNANFISVKGPELLTATIGESEANIREVFEKARQRAPCIVFFDEIDSLARSRAGGQSSRTNDNILSTLSSEMDRKGTKGAVFTIGATNRPDLLDSALLRPGRFNTQVYVGVPDEESRFSILKTLLRDTPLHAALDDAYLRKLANELDGFSGADLSSVCNHARRLAIRRCLDTDSAEADQVLTDDDIRQSRKQVAGSVTAEMLQRCEKFRGSEGDIESLLRASLFSTQEQDDDTKTQDEKAAAALRKTILAIQAKNDGMKAAK